MQYLADRISLEDLEDWSAEASIDNYNNRDDLARRMVYSIRALLNDHEEDESPSGLKEDLLDTILVEFLESLPSSQSSELYGNRSTEELRVAA